MTTLAELRDECAGVRHTRAYAAKMFHPLTAGPVVDRLAFILGQCKGRKVLDIGATGHLHAGIVSVAEACYGISRYPAEGVVGLDLDDYASELPKYWGVEVVVIGEVLEHLSNPGQFLAKLHAAYACQKIFTVPNAFNSGGRKWIAKGTENVNVDHVAWYSQQTLRELLSRHGMLVDWWGWYNGEPGTAEGLIAVVNARI